MQRTPSLSSLLMHSGFLRARLHATTRMLSHPLCPMSRPRINTFMPTSGCCMAGHAGRCSVWRRLVGRGKSALKGWHE
jgi:hypothetical protein